MIKESVSTLFFAICKSVKRRISIPYYNREIQEIYIVFQQNYIIKGMLYMRILLVDGKRNEMINVKVEVNRHMFIVTPEIKNDKFNYIHKRLTDIRNKYMEQFIKQQGLNETYDEIIIAEIRDLLEEEAERIHEAEGIMYYTV